MTGAGRDGPPASGTVRRTDPLGKRALFGASADGAGAPEAGPGPVGDPFAPSPATGRRALFSESGPGDVPAHPAGRGTVATVVCRTCHARTPLGVAGLATRLVPSLWVPGRRWSRLLRCPACGRPAWCRLEWGPTRQP